MLWTMLLAILPVVLSVVLTGLAGIPVHADVASDNANSMFVLVQTSVRNADGTLLTYLESTKFSHINYAALGKFLDHESAAGRDPTMILDGQQYQVIRRATTQSIDAYDVTASTNLYDQVAGSKILLARFSHDGYPVHPGDTVQSIWTFVRPI